MTCPAGYRPQDYCKVNPKVTRCLARKVGPLNPHAYDEDARIFAHGDTTECKDEKKAK